MLTTPNCTMYCRYCTRKRATLTRGGWEGVSKNDEQMIDYVRKNPQIKDVIVSGGDPLTLPLPKLRYYLENLKAIDHVDVIRIGTRVPVTLPQRLYDQELLDLLAETEKVYIQTHFNHPREITPEAAERGPLAAVCNGDMIALDVSARTLTLEISEAEMAARLAVWAPPATLADMPGHGYRKLYQTTVTQADIGCDFDFMLPPMTRVAPVLKDGKHA